MSEAFRISIRIQDNTQKTKEELETAMERALYAIGVKGVEGSVDAISGKLGIDPAVDTGRLRASISFVTPTQKGDSGLSAPSNAKLSDKVSEKAEKNSVVIGTNVEYAEYVHNGTSRMPGRPFLRKGIDKTKNEMQEQAEKIFKGQL